MVLATDLKFFTSAERGLKLKDIKSFGANFYDCQSYRGKSDRRAFLFFPFWRGLEE